MAIVDRTRSSCCAVRVLLLSSSDLVSVSESDTYRETFVPLFVFSRFFVEDSPEEDRGTLLHRDEGKHLSSELEPKNEDLFLLV